MSIGEDLLTKIKAHLYSLEICREHLQNLLSLYAKQEECLDTFEKEAVRYAQDLVISRERNGRDNLLRSTSDTLIASLSRFLHNQQQRHMECLTTYTGSDPTTDTANSVKMAHLDQFLYESKPCKKDMLTALLEEEEESIRLKTIKELISRQFEQHRSYNLSLENKLCGL